MKFLRKFWEWFFDGNPDDSPGMSYHTGRAKAYILMVFGSILILVIVFVVIWLDNFFRYNF